MTYDEKRYRIGVLSERVREALTPDLLHARYRPAPDGGPVTAASAVRGHCYVASEAMYHLMRREGIIGYAPRSARYEGGVHWWLANAEGERIDLTAEQFGAMTLRRLYREGRARGFLTRLPSRRARIVMERASAEGSL